MRKTELNNTGVDVSAIGFGAMHLSLSGRPDEDEAINVLHRVLSMGVTFIDTADSYCIDESDKHHNEKLVARALDSYEGDTNLITVATKGGMMRDEGRWDRNGSPEHIRQTIWESYRALGGDAPIQIWQHHAPDPDVPVQKSIQPAVEAVDDGIIRFVGVSNYSVEQIEKVRDLVDVVTVQNQYSPWHRKPEEDGVLEYCEEEGITFLPYSPLGGRSRAKDLDEYDEIVEMAEEKGISPQRLVLAWLMARSPQILPIPGASQVATAEDSLQAVDVKLTEDEVQRLDRIAA